MPGVIEAITFLAISAQAGALTTGLVSVFSAYSGIIGTVVSVGLTFLSSQLFRPQQPKPEDVQVSVKNPTAPRQRHYGRVKTTGPWVFAECKGGSLHKVIALGTGRLDAIEEVWRDDKILELEEDGDVVGQGDRILTRLGLPTETHYAELEAVFPEWDPDHRGDGVASLYAYQGSVGAEDFAKKFPNGANTLYRVVARGSRVYNPLTGTTQWTDNAAAVIRDYLIHSDGMRLPSSLAATTQAAAGWLAAAQRCAEAVTKKAGGTEDRYRLWGTYTFDERPADVLGRMLQCCDGRIVPTPDGGVTLDVGTWEEPDVVIDEDAITGFSDVSRGRDIMTTANVIRATYLSPFHDYQATDAEPWRDEDDVSARGEIVQDMAFNMAPSHGQARRLMKLAAYRANPRWIGTWQCNLRALAAFGKRFVRLKYDLFGIDEVVEIVDFRFDIRRNEDGIQHLIGVTLQVHSMPEGAYEWDAATEEGTEPVAEAVAVDDTIPVPDNFTFVVDRIRVGQQFVPVGVISFDAPPSAALTVAGEYRRVGLGETWQVIGIADGATSARTAPLEDGEDYEARVRHVTITGRVGDWSDVETVGVVADTTAPSPVSGVSATGGAGQVLLSWTSPNSPNFVAVNIYRNTTNNAGTATLVHTEYGPASNSDSYTNTGLSAGTYYYWLAARNGSGVESSKVATGAVSVS